MRLDTKTTLAALALLVLALACAPEARACSCMGERPACEALGGSTAVFVGRVVGAAEQKTVKDAAGADVTLDVGAIHFAVEEAFSGVKAGARVTVHSGTGGGDCGYWFRRGERYVVYAGGDLKARLHTSVCTRTRPLADAGEDLAFLRALPAEGAGVRLYGVVAAPPGEAEGEGGERKPEGLAGITVTVRDARGRRREVVTGGDGRYELAGLSPGEYEVSAALPDYYHRGERDAHKIRIQDRGCAEASFSAIPDGRLAGQVVDAEGKPVPNARVVLIRAKAEAPLSMHDEVDSEYVRDDPRGRFEFEQLPPGEYLLGLNVTFSPDAEQPYPPTFYPGVSDRALATVVKLGMGQKLKGYVLRLPPRLAERSVQGVVVWPDGSPAAGAKVELTDERHPGWTANGTAETDAHGRFTLTGYDGVTYRVHASADRFPAAPHQGRQPMHAEPPAVTLTGAAPGVRLVLTSEGSLCKHYYQEKPRK